MAKSNTVPHVVSDCCFWLLAVYSALVLVVPVVWVLAPGLVIYPLSFLMGGIGGIAGSAWYATHRAGGV